MSNSFVVTDPFVSEVVNPRFPFFCTVHGFGFTDQAQFFGHLNFAHHVPLAVPPPSARRCKAEG